MTKKHSETRVESSKNRQLEESNIQLVSCAHDLNLPCLIDKFANIAIENNDATLVISTSIAISIVIYTIAKSMAEVIKAWRYSE